MARRAKKPGAFDYKIGGISAKYYVVLYVLVLVLYFFILPLPITFYQGDTFEVTELLILVAVATLAGRISRLWRRWRK